MGKGGELMSLDMLLLDENLKQLSYSFMLLMITSIPIV